MLHKFGQNLKVFNLTYYWETKVTFFLDSLRTLPFIFALLRSHWAAKSKEQTGHHHALPPGRAPEKKIFS